MEVAVLGIERGAPRPIPACVLDQVNAVRRRPSGRRERRWLRAADRQRRQGDPHQRRRTDAGLQHAADVPFAATSIRAAVTRRTGRHQVVIDATSAEKHHIALGSDINILFRGPTQEFTVVGTVEFGGEKNLGGTTSAYFDTATAQKVLGSPGMFDAIDVRAGRSLSQASSPKRLDAAAAGRHGGSHRCGVAKENADAVRRASRW